MSPIVLKMKSEFAKTRIKKNYNNKLRRVKIVFYFDDVILID